MIARAALHPAAIARVIAWAWALGCCGLLGGSAWAQAVPSPAQQGQPPALMATGSWSSLLAQGQAQLAQGDAAGALQSFEQAAGSAHEASIELGWLRAQMQLGHYRQALAFAAHTAGVHADEVAGRVFYAWLLDLGAQPVIARQVLQPALAAAPAGEQALPPSGTLPAWPEALAHGAVDFGPVSTGAVVPVGVHAVASAWLMPGGRQALVPASAWPLQCAALPGTSEAASSAGANGAQLWVRNGLGQTVVARILDRDEALGVVLLHLDEPLPAAVAQAWAPQDASPGAPLYAFDHLPQGTGLATWPHLRVGFAGRQGRLGVNLPGRTARGGPVYDMAGRLVGLSAAAPWAVGLEGITPDAFHEPDRLVPASALRARFGPALGPVDDAPKAAPLDAEAIYELGLRSTLQVLRR